MDVGFTTEKEFMRNANLGLRVITPLPSYTGRTTQSQIPVAFPFQQNYNYFHLR